MDEFKRKKSPGRMAGRHSALPKDFLKMIGEVFSNNFEPGVKAVEKIKGAESHFYATGAIFNDEVMLTVSLMHEGSVTATTVHASADFDPKANSPTAQELLGACVDAAGAVYGMLLDPEVPDMIEAVAHESLSAMENVPFEWSEVELDRFKVYVIVDKSNPSLEEMTEKWLEKNDPDIKKRRAKEHEETESLFVTGKKRPSGPSDGGDGSGNLH